MRATMIVQRPFTLEESLSFVLNNYYDKIIFFNGVLGGLKLTRETIRLGNVVARSKLKGIDGGSYKGWSMWFNSTYREKPYQILYRIFF